jgi:MSHA pilin protein MshD
MLKQVHGVTLIELIAGIVMLGISLSLITAVLGPMAIKSADPWHQVRAAELGQSLINEILAKSFDEHSSRSGSLLRCNENGAPACTLATSFGPESETRSQYDDVDDFHNLDLTGDEISNIFGNDVRLQQVYRAFRVQVQVSYDSALAKRIVVYITTPGGDSIEFAAIKGNW